MGDDGPESRRTGHTTGSSVLTPPTGLSVVAASLLAPTPTAPAAVPCAEPIPATPQPAAVSVPPDVAAPRDVAALPEVAAPSDVAAALPTSCLCGHEAAAHEHWRRGTDCGACGAVACPSFRRRGGRVRRLLRRLRLVR